MVGSQGSSLIGANDGGGSKGFNGGKRSNDGVLFGHFHGSEGEAGGNDSRETFWNSGNGQSDGNLEVVDGTLEESSVDGIAEVSEVDNPNQNTDDTNVL